MKIALTFDSMEEMEAYCMSFQKKRVTTESPAGVPGAATVPNTMPVSTPAVSVMPAQSMPVQSTASTPYPAAVPMTAPLSGQVSSPAVPTAPQRSAQIPTTAVAPEYSYDQLAIAAAGLVNAGKGGQLHTVLQRFGVQAMTELPKEHYGEFATALRAEGAVI